MKEGGQVVWQLWAPNKSPIITSVQPLLSSLFSQHVGVETQHPRPLNLSLMSTDFLVHIKEDDEREEKTCMTVVSVQQAFV